MTVNFVPLMAEGDEATLMRKLDITYMQAQILKRMWKSGALGAKNFPNPRSTRQHVYKIRPRLERHGIYIVHFGRGRYGLTQASRQILDALTVAG